MTVTLNLPDDLAAEIAARPDADEFVAAAVADALNAEKAGRGNGHAAVKTAGRNDASKYWDRQNARRVFLIKKELNEKLTPVERDELDRLQTEMSEHLNTVRPLPFEALERLEKYVDEAESRLSGKS